MCLSNYPPNLGSLFRTDAPAASHIICESILEIYEISLLLWIGHILNHIIIFFRNLPLFQHATLLLIESLLFLPELTFPGCKVITYQCIEIFVDRHPDCECCCPYSFFFPYWYFEIYPAVMLFCVLVFILRPVHWYHLFSCFLHHNIVVHTTQGKDFLICQLRVSYRENFVWFCTVS